MKVLSGKLLDPTGLAEAGMEVPNPYPLTRVPDCPHMPLSNSQKKTLKITSSDPDARSHQGQGKHRGILE
jgi:hypothetical protein